MSEVTEFSVSYNITSSPYFKPYKVNYTQKGKEATWDGLAGHDAVAILIYHRIKDSFIFVKQFRPPVYAAKLRSTELQPVSVDKGQCAKSDNVLDPARGVCIELCAGLMDKKGTDTQTTAAEEIWEECGYKVNPENLKYITSARSGVGSFGGFLKVYYAEVTDSEYDSTAGGGIAAESEHIDLVYWPVDRCEELLNLAQLEPVKENEAVDDPLAEYRGHDLSPSLLFSVYWFLRQTQTLKIVRGPDCGPSSAKKSNSTKT